LRIAARRMLRAVLVIVVLGTTTGCATAFLYDRADRLTNRWMGSYVELDASQQDAVDAGLTELHRWHRHEQLPAYADWLRGLAARLGDDRLLSEAEMRELGAELGEFWREFAGAALPLMVGIGADLRDEQVAGLIQALRDEQSVEFEAASRRADDWHQRRRARSTERLLRRWTGPLTSEQRAAKEAWAATLEPTHEAQYHNRMGWIDELERALQQRSDAGALLAEAERLFVMPQNRWSPEVEALIARNSARTTAYFVDFLNGLDRDQRERAITRLERLAAEFDQLSRTGA
jgi:hypothetical protein